MSTTDESRAVVEAWYKALTEGDMATFTGLFHENVVAYISGSSTPLSGRYDGRDAFVNEVIGPVFAKLDPESARFGLNLKIFAAEGPNVAATMQGDATSLTGKRYNNSYCQLFTVDDGQIVEYHEYMDTALLLDALFSEEAAASA